MRFFLSSHGASPYGAERVLLTLAQGLQQRGHHVTLEIPHEGPALATAEELVGVEVWHSRRPRLPRNVREGLSYAVGAAWATARLWRKIRRGKYDVVWVNSLFNPLAAAAGRLAGPTVIWHIHERNFPGPLRPLGSLAVRTGSDVPVPVSGFVSRTFSTGGLPNSHILFEPLCKVLPPVPLRPRDEEFVVGYVGQFEPRKRVLDLLGAVARVENVRALLVGDGKMRPQVEKEIERLEIGSRVTLAGLQKDVHPFYARMDCVVIPSRDEPCALVASEAMAVGRPVIAAQHGGLPEVLGDAALYYPMGDVAALAAQIRRLQASPVLAAELRERGLARAPLFSVDGWLDQVESIVQAATTR
jgi:glycosyltransferase involved in cell wall biosynthesis